MAIHDEKSNDKKLHQHKKLTTNKAKKYFNDSTLRCRDCEEEECLDCEIFKNFTPDNK